MKQNGSKKGFTLYMLGRAKNNAGFTIVETLVVVGIIMILSVILLPNYKRFHDEFSLLRSAHKLAQDLRRAQEMASSAKEFQGGVPSGGYGIYVESGETTYILYADKNPEDQRYSGVNEIVEDPISLEKGVIVQSVSPNPVHITSKGPDPITLISGGGESVTIVLGLEGDPLKTKEVFVNKAGLIYVKQ